MKKILVTGAQGQLGKCIQDASKNNPHHDFYFADRETLDVSDASCVEEFFQDHDFDYCINAAAYTHVDNAESDKENAFSINAEAVKYLSHACKKHDIVLLHVSTDYVFDGTAHIPYIETDPVNPINVYGASKLKGEQYLQAIWHKHFIVRTSWLYSQYGHNFMKSMLKFAESKKELTITTEQTGTPTNANDLAWAMLKIIDTETAPYGVYHFSNAGTATWYDFAKAIMDFSGLSKKVRVVETDYYHTFAKRPKYSVLDTTKATQALHLEIPKWEESLKQLLKAT